MRRYALILAAPLLCLPSLLLCQGPPTQGQAATVQWSFSRSHGAEPLSSTGAHGKIEGEFAYVAGLAGDALRFDGYTTGLTLPAAALPSSTNGFAVEAWVALNTYPWNRLPIADQEEERQTGYALEIDASGHLALSASVDGRWVTTTSTRTVSLKHWAHLAGSYTVHNGEGQLSIYLDGQQVASAAVQGTFTPATATKTGKLVDLLVGRVREPQMPFPEAEIRPKEPIWYSLDGLLGGLSYTAGGLSAERVGGDFAAGHAPTQAVLPYTPMPSGPAEPGRFGAYYTGLHYEEAWDHLRRVDGNSDVVVRFPDSPNRLVFWQGLNYIPAWVTGDDKWYTDEFLEVWNEGCPDGGDCEPMSDKQERFSHVNIVESNDARAVVHWRYALTEVVGNKGAWRNERTGWFDWADEYWTIYPDGIAVRKQVLHSDHPEAVHEWQETIVLHQPGMRPEDDIQDDAVTLGNMAGETRTFSWTPKHDSSFANPTGPSGVAPPSEPNLQIVHLKSAWQPFQIVPPQGASADFYNNEKSYFTFECWNHWPVAQIASSDRACVTTDRPSHSSLSHLFWQPAAQTPDSTTKLLLSGLTQHTLHDLLPLARSWLTPPVLQLEGGAAIPYDPAQRAYVLPNAESLGAQGLQLTLQAKGSSPAFHPAILLQGWGERKAEVTVNGKRLRPGPGLHVAFLPQLDRTDLLLWLPLEAQQPVHLVIRSAP